MDISDLGNCIDFLSTIFEVNVFASILPFFSSMLDKIATLRKLLYFELVDLYLAYMHLSSV